MKDDFLKAYQKEPPVALVEETYRRIKTMPTNTLSGPATTRAQGRRRRPLVVAGVLALLILLLSPLFLTTVRALMEDVVREIGGLTLRETDLYPGGGDARVEPTNRVTLAEAREMVSFAFALPTAVPEQYTMNEEVLVVPGFKSVTVNYKNEGERGDAFSLRVSPADPEVDYLVGPDSIDVVEVNGREAQFITGGWEANREVWNPNIARMLRWEQDGIEYQLSASGAATCPEREDYVCPLTKEGMIEIANSIPALPAGGGTD